LTVGGGGVLHLASLLDIKQERPDVVGDPIPIELSIVNEKAASGTDHGKCIETLLTIADR
jgi:hypothetical protein